MENRIRDAHAEYMQWQVDQINVLGDNWEQTINQIAKMLETAFNLEPGTLGGAKWKDIETAIEDAPQVPVPSGMPQWMKLVINDSTELDVYVEGVVDEKNTRDTSTQDWSVYD